MFSLLQDQAALSKAWPFPAQKVIPFSLYHACPAVTAVQGFSEHLLPPGMHCQMGTFCTCTFLPFLSAKIRFRQLHIGWFCYLRWINCNAVFHSYHTLPSAAQSLSYLLWTVLILSHPWTKHTQGSTSHGDQLSCR